jgi:hypothetical protein
MFGTLFLLGVSVSISYSKTMFYTEIKAATITNQSICSLKELQNKKLVFLSRGDQSISHFAIGFIDTLGQLVDYATYDNLSPIFTCSKISISPDANNAIISGTALGGSLISTWRDPRIIYINLNTKAINWAKNMGPGCIDGSGHAVEVIDNSTAIISYMNYNSNFLCSGAAGVSVIEKVNLNTYNVIYRKAIRSSGNNSTQIHMIFKIVKLPGNMGIGVLAGNYVGHYSDYVVSYNPNNLIIISMNSENISWFKKEPFSKVGMGFIAASFRNSFDEDDDVFKTAFLLATSDSGILAAGINYPVCSMMDWCVPDAYENIYSYSIDSLLFGLVRMVVIKFDKYGNILWSKQYYLDSFSIQPNGLAEVSDGYIIGAVVGHYEFGFYQVLGQEEPPYTTHKEYYRYYHPAIIKIDKNNGNIIWAYKYIPANDIVNPSQRITFSWFPSFDNIVITYDSGIVVYGFRVKHTINNPIPHMKLKQVPNSTSITFNEQYGWILKTDKNGNTCPSVQKQSLNLVVENYSYISDNSVNYYAQDYNFNPDNYNPTQTTGLYYTNNNCYITPVSNNESNNCSSKEFKLLNNKIVFDQERDFKIYNLEGKLIYSGKAKEYIIKKDGFYILKINNNTYKILIK